MDEHRPLNLIDVRQSRNSEAFIFAGQSFPLREELGLARTQAAIRRCSYAKRGRDVKKLKADQDAVSKRAFKLPELKQLLSACDDVSRAAILCEDYRAVPVTFPVPIGRL